MLARRLYYLLKPILPWRLRIALRRMRALRRLEAHRSVWPIDQAAGETPPDWAGWPEDKKFCVVLTHDVEGPEGVAKCRQLAELEMQCGFRSSFNFIPEGSYSVPQELREWLEGNGFEVGVHDLHHDGKLFESFEGYRQKSVRINQYLKEWKAVGFRGGFMLRNLAWIHDLNIAYDASTFDTDPFEPQSDGVGTIFPFWIPKGRSAAQNSEGIVCAGGGYVELPYTLPQDSTLFLVLREMTPAIWLQKTEWLASKGGMVLVNVHPDYVRFSQEKVSRKTFSADHYRRLLEHIRQSYEGTYWQPRARDLATWFKGSAKEEKSSATQHAQRPHG